MPGFDEQTYTAAAMRLPALETAMKQAAEQLDEPNLVQLAAERVAAEVYFRSFQKHFGETCAEFAGPDGAAKIEGACVSLVGRILSEIETGVFFADEGH